MLEQFQLQASKGDQRRWQGSAGAPDLLGGVTAARNVVLASKSRRLFQADRKRLCRGHLVWSEQVRSFQLRPAGLLRLERLGWESHRL